MRAATQLPTANSQQQYEQYERNGMGMVWMLYLA
jgi:hypothetical protein